MYGQRRRGGAARAGSPAQVTDEPALISAYCHSGAHAPLPLQYSLASLDDFELNRYNLLAVADLARRESVVSGWYWEGKVSEGHMGRVIREVLQIIQSELHQLFHVNLLMEDPIERLEDQLRVLYGRGEISAESYRQLRFRLHRGLIDQADLHVAHMEATQRNEAQGRYAPRHLDLSLERWLDRLHADRVLLEDMRGEFEAKIKELRGEVVWIKEQAEAIRQDAARVLPDEGASRSLLEAWQKLLTLSQTLETQIRSMEQDLLSLNTFDVEIKATITKIAIVQSRQQMEHLSQHVRHDLITGGG